VPVMKSDGEAEIQVKVSRRCSKLVLLCVQGSVELLRDKWCL
jgi:hypothetical protein